MANLIQIKRSTGTDAPAAGGLVTGELAYSLLASSNSLFVGDGSNNALRIGGGKYLWLHQANVTAPGALTANAVVIVNGNSFTTSWKTNSLTVGADGETVAISNISTAANTTQLGGSAGGANTELASTWAVKTYVDGKVAAAIPVLTSTFVGFGNSSNYLGGSAGFTFDSTTNAVFIANTLAIGANVNISTSSISVGNSTINTAISASGVDTDGTLAVLGATTLSNTASIAGTLGTGNTTVTGFINASSYGTFNGTVNATALNIGSNVVVTTSSITTGNSTVNTVISSSGVDTDGTLAVLGATTLSNTVSVAGTLGTGNTTITGSANVTTTLQVGGASTLGNNVTVTGTINATAINVSADLSVAGNLIVSGTLTTIDTTNLNVKDALIRFANGNLTTDTIDVGSYGSYGNATVTQYTGFFRDQSDGGIWKLFAGAIPEPTTTVDTANVNFGFATLQTFLKSGGLVSNTTAVTLTANSTLAVNMTANTLSLTTALTVPNGGTGATTFANNGVLFGYGTGAIQVATAGADGTVLQISSNVPAFGTLDGGSF